MRSTLTTARTTTTIAPPDLSASVSDKQQGGVVVDITAVVISIAIVLVIAIVACIIYVLFRRGSKRSERNYAAQIDETDANSQEGNHIVEGIVEGVVDDETLCIDTQNEEGDKNTFL